MAPPESPLLAVLKANFCIYRKPTVACTGSPLLYVLFVCQGLWVRVAGPVCVARAVPLHCRWVFVDAFAAVSSEWSRLFFIAYWLLSLNMLNIAQSFLIDAAVEQIKDVEQEEEEVRAADGTLQATIYGHHAVFNADRLTGTMTGLTGQYTAMVPGYLDPNEAQRLIHDLFRTERTDHRMDEQHFGLRLNL